MLAFLELSAGYVEDHVQEQYMIDHIVENYDLQYHITIENHMKDHPDGQHVTSDQHIMLIGQQQPEDLGPQHEDITW